MFLKMLVSYGFKKYLYDVQEKFKCNEPKKKNVIKLLPYIQVLSVHTS